MLADFFEAHAEVGGDSTEAPWQFDSAIVESGQNDQHHVVMGQRRPDGRPVEDVWVTSNGTAVHFRVMHKDGLIAVGDVGLVEVAFGSVDGAKILARESFETGPNMTLVLPSGARTSPPGFYSGPAGPLRELRIGTSSPVVHVGLKSWDPESEPAGVRSKWQSLRFDTWLDPSVSGRVTAAPDIRLGPHCGRVWSRHWGQWLDGRCAQLEFDPRNEAQRLQIGRHRLHIAWSVHGGQTVALYRAEASILVQDDGSIELTPPV